MRPLFRILTTTVFACGLAAAVTSALRAQAPAAEPRIWQGVYTAAQAERGKETYTSTCLRCHGADLMGVTAPALSGDRFFASWGGEPIDRLFVKIRDTMPPTFSTSAIDDKTKLEIVTYILQTNGFPAGTAELAVGTETMSTAAILKKGQQATVQNFSLVQTVGCLAPGDNNTWRLTRTAEPIATREDAPTPQSLQSAAARPLGARTFLLLSVVPFSPASHVGEKMEARGLVYNDPADSRITLTSLKPTGANCQ
jgi:S-disulfanyl-L-cysteine oxidoreductase SoxD